MPYARAVSMPKKNYSPETKKVSGYWNSTSTTFANGSQSRSILPDRPNVSLPSPNNCESSRSTAGPIRREPHLSQSSACEIWDVFCYFPCPKKSRKFHYGHSKKTASQNYWVRTQGERCTCRSTGGPDILVRKEDICFEGKFHHLSIGEPKKHNICEVFIPEFDCSFFGIVKSFGMDDVFYVELLNFDPKTENTWKKLDSPVMKWIAGEKLLRVKLCPLIRSIFGASHPVGRGDLCTFFLPGLGSFDVYVHKTWETECEIQFVDTSVNKSVKEAGCRLGSKFFKKSASQGHYFVKREFLKKKEVIDQQPVNLNNNPYDSSNYQNDVEMLDTNEMKGDTADADFKRQISQSEPPGFLNLEDDLDEFKLQYLNKLCSINEDYMRSVCDKSEHYGHVVDVVKKENCKVVGIELIETCHCSIICDGKYEGKYYIYSMPQKCLFVESQVVEIVPFSPTDLDFCLRNDICEVFIPITDKKIYFGRYKYATERYVVEMLENYHVEGGRSSDHITEIYSSDGLTVALNRAFVSPVFRSSASKVEDKCEVFVPRRGTFSGIVVDHTFVATQSLGVYKVSFSEEDTELLRNERSLNLNKDGTFVINSLFVRKGIDETVPKEIAEPVRKGINETVPKEIAEPVKKSNPVGDEENAKDVWQIVGNPSSKKDNVDNLTLTDTYHYAEPSTSSYLNDDNNFTSLYPSVNVHPASLNDREPEWHVKIGDFCVVDRAFMSKLCERPDHYGNVFTVLPLPRKPGAIVGLKLINTCICKTITDGVYQGQLMIDKRRPSRCLFINLRKIKIIEFDDFSSNDVNVDDVCHVYVPSVERHYYGVIRSFEEPRDIQVQMLDFSCQYHENFHSVNPELQENFADGPIVLVKLRYHFVKSVFRCSAVKKGDICHLFVPGQGKFQCLVEGMIEHNFHVCVLEGNIDMAKVTVDEKFFKKIDEGQFCVSEYFLECVRSTTTSKKESETTGGEDAIENRDDESIEADVLEHDKEDKKPKSFVSHKTHIGRFKGIQGHNNSCYMDSLLYSLFLFNDSLDQIFELKSDDDMIHMEMKNQFRRLIVNPLRSDKGYVKQEHVMHLREMLEPYLPGVSKDEKDAEELLSVLFSKNFAGKNGYPPLLHLHNVLLNEDQHLFVYQIFVEAESDEEFFKMQKSIPHVNDILALSFVLQGQFLKENPQTFLVQLPRFGKEKLFPGVYLPAELDISEISAYGDPVCCICEDAAVLRCRECTLKKSSEKFAHKSADEKFSIMNFCQRCFELLHKTKQNHQTEILQFSKPSSHSQSSSLYSLEAVICIETSHYVSFVRAKKEKPEDGFCWLFFDSMADREENRATSSEYNVPMVKAVANIGAHLNKLDSSSPEERYEYVASFSYTKEDELFKRLVQDAYICVYKQKERPKSTLRKCTAV